MGCKYVKEFDFTPYKCGGKVATKYAEGGSVKADLKQDKKMIAQAVHKHEKAQHPGKPLTKLKKGGSVLEKATGERYPSKAAMVKHEMRESPREQREEMVQKRVVRGPAMAAGRDPRAALLKPPMAMPPAMKKGGKFEAKVKTVMHEFGKGELHSGKSDKIVTNPKQAIAISLSEARRATKKGK